MTITDEQKQEAIAVLKGLGGTDLHEVTRWCFIWILSQRQLPGGCADDSSEATLEVIRQSAVQRIAKICKWSVLGREATAGTMRLVNRVAALADLVASLTGGPGISDLSTAVNEGDRDYPPVGCGRKTYQSGIEVSGILL